MGLILFIVASLLKITIAPFSYIYGSIKSIGNKEFNNYNKNLALAKDQYGNRLCSYLFNDILITKEGYKFGNINETISSVIGKNKLKGTLTKSGRFLDRTLDLLDNNHSIKSINNHLTNN